MVVQHNINAMTAYNKLNVNVTGLKKSSEKLASGYRINRAGDDAAGLAISEKMRSQIKGLNQAVRNSQDGINMIQTFEGAATNTHEILQRMKVLAEESANGNYQNEVDREALQLEFDSLNDELNQIADTDFNGVVMLNGGQMADGLKAIGGKFDYENSDRAAMELGTASGLIIGIGDDGNTTTDEETVTFTASKKADGTVTWTPSAGSKGTAGVGSDDTYKTGGFIYNGVSVNIDTNNVVSGDTITLHFKPASVASAKGSEITGTSTDWGTVTDAATDKKVTNASFKFEDDLDTKLTSQSIVDAVNYLNEINIETVVGAKGTGMEVKSVKVNGVDLNVTAGKAVTASGDDKDHVLKAYDDGSSIFVKADSLDVYYKDKAGNEIKLGAFTMLDATNAGTAGTVTTNIYTSKASFTPAGDKGVEILEPKGKVSQANSNFSATAPLTYTDHLVLQTGARTKDSVDFTFAYNTEGMGNLKANLNMSSRADGLNTANLSLTTQKDANYAIDQINNAINKVSMIRATFGATQNRLEYKIDNLTTTATNVQEAESAIRDTDMASEMMNYTKYSILQQAAQSMLAQANQQPQGILQLLG